MPWKHLTKDFKDALSPKVYKIGNEYQCEKREKQKWKQKSRVEDGTAEVCTKPPVSLSKVAAFGMESRGFQREQEMTPEWW